MRDIHTIEQELETKRQELTRLKGTETEVYARIVGYYRSLNNWNRGKREEFDHRRTFAVDSCLNHAAAEGPKPLVRIMEAVDLNPVVLVSNKDRPISPGRSSATPGTATAADSHHATTATYRYYYRATCPGCTAMKAVIEDLNLTVRSIDVDEPEGFSEAAADVVTATPQLIALDQSGAEVWRTGDPRQVVGLAAARSAR